MGLMLLYYDIDLKVLKRYFGFFRIHIELNTITGVISVGAALETLFNSCEYRLKLKVLLEVWWYILQIQLCNVVWMDSRGV